MPRSGDPVPSVLVWGGLGFLGRRLVRGLLDDGLPVSVLCRARSLYPVPEWAPEVTWYELDKGGSPELVLFEAVAAAAVIYNFAGSSGAVASNRDPVRSLRENCQTQLAFLSACETAGHKPHVVFASSWLVYAPAGRKLVHEDHPLGPLSMYGAHKLCIEQYLRIYERRGAVTFTVCRISNPYGADQSHAKGGYKILNAFIQSALAQKPITIFGDGSQLRDFIYIDDVVHAFRLCGFSPHARNQVFNISSGRSFSLREAVNVIVEVVGETPVVFQPWPDEYCAVEPGDYLADIGRAASRLGFQPQTDLRTGLVSLIGNRNENTAAIAMRSGL